MGNSVLQPDQEGLAPFKPSSRNIDCKTSYKIFGDITCGKPPVIILHGGPGVGHEYLLPFAQIWKDYGLPVIFYDQIGCAASTRLPETAGDESFWTMDLFVEELNNLIDHLGLRETGFHILGQSWGGMLAAEFATRQPKGLRRLVLASAISSTESNRRGCQELRSKLPPDAQDALNEAEKTDAWDEPAAKAAVDNLTARHVWRTPDLPAELFPAFQHKMEETTVYETMYAKCWMAPKGSLDNWTSIPQLHKIIAPTLVYNGEFDTSTDITTQPFFEHIPRVRWITFPSSGHFCHLESGFREKVLQIVGSFLAQGQ